MPSPQGHATPAEQAYTLGQGTRPASYVDPPKPWRPWKKVENLTDKLTSDPTKKTRELEAKVKAARAEVTRRREQHTKAIEAAEAARDKANNKASLAEEANKLKIDIGEAQVKRLEDYERKSKAADQQLWIGAIGPGITRKSGIIGEAEQVVEDTQWALDNFVTEHADELAKDLKADQESVHKAITELYKQLAPLQDKHDELTRTLSELYGRTEGVTRGHIPIGQYDKKPALLATAPYESVTRQAA